MQRWQATSQRIILQSIADDARRPDSEREAARRELSPQAQVASPKRGRNSNAPMSQADTDSDLERELTFRSNDGLTTQNRIEITRGLDPATLQILDAIQNNILLWLFTSNSTDVPVLIDIIGKTGSSLVKEKAMSALRLIAQRSPIESAKLAAQTFLDQLDQEK
jgi:hypothetical protein